MAVGSTKTLDLTQQLTAERINFQHDSKWFKTVASAKKPKAQYAPMLHNVLWGKMKTRQELSEWLNMPKMHKDVWSFANWLSNLKAFLHKRTVSLMKRKIGQASARTKPGATQKFLQRDHDLVVPTLHGKTHVKPKQVWWKWPKNRCRDSEAARREANGLLPGRKKRGERWSGDPMNTTVVAVNCVPRLDQRSAFPNLWNLSCLWN